MGFGGGGGGVLTAHTHDPAIPLDGGSLAANATSFSLANQSLLVSDGINIQELGIGSDGDNLTSIGGALSWEAHVAGDVLASNLVMTNSTTIGDYTQPTSATCSSAGTLSPTYETDFSTNTGWSPDDTHVFITTGTNRLEFELDDSGTDEFINYDMGVGNISDTAWCLRFVLTFSTWNINGINNNNILNVGNYDNAAPSGYTASGDALQWGQYVRTSFTSKLRSVDNGVASETDSSDNPFDVTTATATPYYCELKRVSATELEFRAYANSDYSTGQIGTTITRTTTATVDALRYITIQLFNQGVVVGAGYTGYIQNLQFWNGVSSPSATCAMAIDDNVATSWASASEVNPNIYVDMASSTTTSNLALYPNAGTTELEIKIQSSSDAIAWTDQRTITWSNLTEGAWNYIRFNLLSARYWRIYGSSGGAGVLQIDEIKVLDSVSDADVRNLHGHIPISATDTALNNAGV